MTYTANKRKIPWGEKKKKDKHEISCFLDDEGSAFDFPLMELGVPVHGDMSFPKVGPHEKSHALTGGKLANMHVFLSVHSHLAFFSSFFFFRIFVKIKRIIHPFIFVTTLSTLSRPRALPFLYYLL